MLTHRAPITHWNQQYEKALQAQGYENKIQEYESKKYALYHALTTRVLTDDELIKARQYGDSLNIQDNAPYYADQKRRELDNAFAIQDLLRKQKPPQ
jgi:hypothetical protein